MKRTEKMPNNDLIEEYAAKFDALLSFHSQYTLLRQIRDLWLSQNRALTLLGAFIGQAAFEWITHLSKHSSINLTTRKMIITRCLACATRWDPERRDKYNQEASKFTNLTIELWLQSRKELLRSNPSPSTSLSLAHYLNQKASN